MVIGAFGDEVFCEFTLWTWAHYHCLTGTCSIHHDNKNVSYVKQCDICFCVRYSYLAASAPEV